MSGAFLVFEGGDGVGKSTQVAVLVERLRARGYTVRQTREPGDTYAGAEIRRLLLDPATGELSPRAEALLYAADKAQHVDEVVWPALRRGEVVVSDRYVDSLLAYQGAHGMDRDQLERLAEWATGGLHADLTVVLDLDPADAVARKESKDRIEGYADEFHARARRHFLELAAAHPERYLVAAARRPVDDIADEVEAQALQVLAARNCRPGTAD